jgi:hypothetical protein
MNESAATFIAPITLMLGAGFASIGLLSLFNLNYFKTRLRGVAALAVGLAFIVVTEALFVTGSGTGRYFDGQQADVTDCEYEAEQVFPFDRHTRSSAIPNHIKLCMERLGYDWMDEHEHCRKAPTATNAFCYLPKGSFDRTLVAFQMKFE